MAPGGSGPPQDRHRRQGLIKDMIAALEGTDLWILLAVVLVLFGGSQLPKLARSIGSASSEFKKGIEEGSKGDPAPADGGSSTSKASDASPTKSDDKS